MNKKRLGPMAIGIALAMTSCASTQNGTLSIEEKFKRYDLNGDQKVSSDEYNEVATRITFLAFDVNEDGGVTLGEWQSLEGQECEPAHFKVHDLNKDGKVSLEEALASSHKRKSFSKDFPGIDTNRDGFVDLPEAKAFAAKVQAATR
jgi:Ca2+-binding EF-hand superfamily protein